MKGPSHLGWIPAGALVGFGAAFLFGDLLTLPVDVYYLVYVGSVLGFLAFYAWRTGLEVATWTRRRLGWGLVLGVLGGVALMRGVLATPPTPRLTGAELVWALFWRGLVYGSVDGLLLLAFPWLVTWRALRAEEARWLWKAGAGLLAWAAVLLVTTAYHLGYRDFRSEKVLQPAVGSTIGAVPTLVSANPVASPLSHVFLHVTAVLHVPETDLFLPPHRAGQVPATPLPGAARPSEPGSR